MGWALGPLWAPWALMGRALMGRAPFVVFKLAFDSAVLGEYFLPSLEKTCPEPSIVGPDASQTLDLAKTAPHLHPTSLGC